MYTFKFRRSTSDRWLEQDPILSNGEPGFETDTGRMKVGNGTDKWSLLKYFVPYDPSGSGTSLQEHIVSGQPHPVYDDGPSLVLLYENVKV